MCNIITENIRPFGRAVLVSHSYDSIGGQIAPEIIRIQVKQLMNKNRLLDRLKVELIGLLSPSKLGTSIVTVYWNPQ